ncbi:MAG: hydrogenase 4 membrane subunit [Raoultibacter sp.]
MSSFALVNILGGLLIITSTIVVLAKNARTSAFLYSAQSFVLVVMFVALATATGSTELYLWSVSAFFTKVLLVPAILLFTLKKIGNHSAELGSRLTPAKSLALVAFEVLICIVAVQGIDLPTAAAVKPALAISLAHFFIGLTCIISQRNIMKQVFGYCLMENGAHVSLALLAPQAPELVEVGIATDAIFAVLVMVIMILRIYRVTNTLDARDLSDLKG